MLLYVLNIHAYSMILYNSDKYTFCREFSVLDNDVNNWVIFDGPITPTWVENLNTALDDKRIICLNNGEVIRLTFTTSIIFENTDLLGVCTANINYFFTIHYKITRSQNFFLFIYRLPLQL